MKKLIAVLVMLTIYEFGFAQSVIVETQKQLNTDFSKYKTYNFASQVDNKLDEGYFFLNDLILKSNIIDAVNSEMQGLGYKKENASPDLIVNFRVFNKSARIKGTEGYGDTFWNGMQVKQLQAADTTSYLTKPGTLFIALIDRKTSNIVWQGFASGLIDNNQFIKDEGKIKEAVNLIFNKYGYRANNY